MIAVASRPSHLCLCLPALAHAPLVSCLVLAAAADVVAADADADADVAVVLAADCVPVPGAAEPPVAAIVAPNLRARPCCRQYAWRASAASPAAPAAAAVLHPQVL